MTIKTTTLLASLALFGVLGCESTQYDFDESLGLDELALVAEKGLDSLEENLNEDGSSLADMVEETEEQDRRDGIGAEDARGDGLTRLRQSAIRLLRKMAAKEDCALQGIVSGRYRGGGFKLAGHWWSEELAGVAKGIYQKSDDRPGGEFRARYRDISRGKGTLAGNYADAGVVHDRFGVFHGEWTPDGADERQGNLFGIWHPLYDKDDGVIFGAWSNCDKRPIHERDPRPVERPDED
jgi:hypothetical protein